MRAIGQARLPWAITFLGLFMVVALGIFPRGGRRSEDACGRPYDRRHPGLRRRQAGLAPRTDIKAYSEERLRMELRGPGTPPTRMHNLLMDHLGDAATPLARLAEGFMREISTANFAAFCRNSAPQPSRPLLLAVGLSLAATGSPRPSLTGTQGHFRGAVTCRAPLSSPAARPSSSSRLLFDKTGTSTARPKRPAEPSAAKAPTSASPTPATSPRLHVHAGVGPTPAGPRPLGVLAGAQGFPSASGPYSALVMGHRSSRPRNTPSRSRGAAPQTAV